MESKIIGYRGIANTRHIKITGHAFEKHKVRVPSPLHDRIRNFRQTIRRYRLKPLKFMEVKVQIDGITSQTIRTNEQGFFTSILKHEDTNPGWFDYELSWKRNEKVFKSQFFRPSENETGVISDIDDTVLVSHSTRTLRKLSLVLFRNAYSRKTIPFIKHWEGHIHDLNKDIHPDGYFYVSNSEWNLYDFLQDFFEINKLPKGVFFLQNLKKGLRDLVSTGRVHSNHKFNNINFLFQFYPMKSFILIGDNGQKDMDIYEKISSLYPWRIKGIMIRKLPYVKNEHRIQGFQEYLEKQKIPFLTYH